MSEQKVEEIKKKIDIYSYWKGHRTVLVLAVVFSLGIGAGVAADSMIGKGEPRNVEASPEPGPDSEPETVSSGQTDYQKNLVECPDRYLPLCTEMSQLHSEPVEFISANETGNNLLELSISDNRTLIAKIKEGGEEGYFMRIES